MGEFLDNIEAVVFSPIDTLHEIAYGTPGPFESQVAVDQQTQDRIRAMGMDPATAPQSVQDQVSAQIAADQQTMFSQDEANNPTSITNLGKTVSSGLSSIPWKSLLTLGILLLLVDGLHEVRSL
jgi:hypothetical protein